MLGRLFPAQLERLGREWDLHEFVKSVTEHGQQTAYPLAARLSLFPRKAYKILVSNMSKLEAGSDPEQYRQEALHYLECRLKVALEQGKLDTDFRKILAGLSPAKILKTSRGSAKRAAAQTLPTAQT